MGISTVLVAGEGIAAAAIAHELLGHGVDVALIGSATDSDAGLADELRSRGVEVRVDVELVGAIDVDDYAEAELSNGRVENYDAIVVVDQRAEPAAAIDSSRVIVVPGSGGADGVLSTFAGWGLIR